MKILSGSVWGLIISISKTATIKRVAVSYFTDESLLNFESGDQLIVDASPNAIASGVTSALALKNLFYKGVCLYSISNFHGKMLIFGNTLIIGSSNISKNSMNNLNEIIQISDDAKLTSESLVIFNDLIRQATTIDRSFISSILKIPVNKMNCGTIIKNNKNIFDDFNKNGTLFRLVTAPKTQKALLRAYFIALIELQIGKLNTEKSFKLWKKIPHLKTHRHAGRITDYGDGLYKLTVDGIKYFNRDEEKPIPTYYEAFTKALISGDENDLPSELKDKKLTVLY